MLKTGIRSSKEVVDELIKKNILAKRDLLNEYKSVDEIFK